MNKKLTSMEFILKYLEYLSKWNQSASLLSIISSYKSVDTDSLEELTEIALFEYYDTQRMTTDHIMSIDEVLNIFISNDRDKKLKELLD